MSRKKSYLKTKTGIFYHIFCMANVDIVEMLESENTTTKAKEELRLAYEHLVKASQVQTKDKVIKEVK